MKNIFIIIIVFVTTNLYSQSIYNEIIENIVNSNELKQVIENMDFPKECYDKIFVYPMTDPPKYIEYFYFSFIDSLYPELTTDERIELYFNKYDDYLFDSLDTISVNLSLENKISAENSCFTAILSNLIENKIFCEVYVNFDNEKDYPVIESIKKNRIIMFVYEIYDNKICRKWIYSAMLKKELQLKSDES